MGCCSSGRVVPTSPGGRDFDGIPSDKAELKIIARLMCDTYQRGTDNRWAQIDETTRKELTIIDNATTHKRGEELPTWEDRQPLKPKYLMKQGACVISITNQSCIIIRHIPINIQFTIDPSRKRAKYTH